MSDDSFETTFGPSAPGAVNLASGDTGNVDASHSANSPSTSTSTSPDGDLTANGKGGYSLTSDAQPSPASPTRPSSPTSSPRRA
jgi:phospholipase C